MTVYAIFSDKAAVDGLIELVLGEVEVAPPTGPGTRIFERSRAPARTTFLAHPHVVPLLGTRPLITPPAFSLVEAITSILLEAGWARAGRTRV